MTQKINTLVYNQYSADSYVLVYQPEGYAFPQTKKFDTLKHALWFVSDLQAACGLKITVDI